MKKRIIHNMIFMVYVLLLLVAVRTTGLLIEEIQTFSAKKTEVEKPLWTDTKEVAAQPEKIAYLTFDDGPSDSTDRILDILKEKNAKATFFVVGKEGKKAKERYQRIVKEGHSLGMHSYTHDYDYIYGSFDNFKSDLKKLQNHLYNMTGEEVEIYRFPGGSSNSVSKISIKKCIQYLKEQGIIYFDWNASSEDAVMVNADFGELNHNILKDALRYQKPIILMHDLHECNGTVEGLEELIDTLREEGYELHQITRETKPVQHIK